MCSWPNMTRVRSSCAKTCGCGSYLSKAGFLAHARFGCPSQCASVLAANLQKAVISGTISPGPLAPLQSCQDAAPNLFTVEPISGYLNGVLEFVGSNAQYVGTLAQRIEQVGGFSGLGLDILESQANSTHVKHLLKESLDQALVGNWNSGVLHPRKLSGCEFWASWEITAIIGIDLCAVGSFRSIRMFCPVSCKCFQRWEQCPMSCPTAGAYTT